MQAAATAAADDEPTPLTLGNAIERPLAGGQSHAYQLALDAGDAATLTVDQHGVDVVVRVDDSHGAPLAEFDLESRREGREPIIAIGAASGPLRLNVRARYPKDPAATYAIHVDAIHPATDRDRTEFDAHQHATTAFTLETAGKFADARKLAMQALDEAERALGPNDVYVGALLTRCAELHRSTGDTADAERLFDRAVAVNVAAVGREHPQTAYALLRQGALYTALNQYAKAEPLLDEGLSITERTLGREHPRVANAILAVVGPHYFLDDYTFVVAKFQHALAIAEKTLDADDFIRIALVNNLGDVYVRLGNYDAALPYSEQALAAIEKRFGPENYRLSNPLMNLAIIYREKQQFAQAMAVARRAYTIREHSFGPNHPDTAAALIHIGHIQHNSGDYAAAIETFQRTLAILESRGPYYEYTRMTLDDLAFTYAAQGDTAHALQYQARADRLWAKSIALNLAIGSEREKLKYAGSLVTSSDQTISMHAREAPDSADAAAEALGLILQRKGQVLDALSGSLSALRERMNADDRAMLDQLGTATTELASFALGGSGRASLDDYQQQLASMEAKRDQLEAEIGRRSAEFRARSMPVTVAAVQQAIPDDAALIEFAVYHPLDTKAATGKTMTLVPHYIAYVLRRNSELKWKELGAANEIDEAVDALRQALRDPMRQDVTKLSRVVDEQVLRPIRSIVGDATRLLISADGELNLIPFEVLVDEQHRYAVERFSISYLTSGRDLLRLQLPRASKSAPLIVANPAFGPPLLTSHAQPATTVATRSTRTSTRTRGSVTTGPDMSVVYFAPLPGTAVEARAIKSLFPDARLLSGAQATKSALAQAEAPALLHIATHGFFLRNSAPAATQVENPLLRSGIALTGANANHEGREAGILTALEASTLNLWGTKLVTLSGCDTGVGDVKNGEGVYGLRRAILLAGAETLVMSLWPVSDYVTREFMTAYYSGLKRGLGRGEALRQAQLAMLASKDYRHPFYWASFIQAGDWTPYAAPAHAATP